MSNQALTIKDIIALSIEDLRTISIPADLLEVFGPPISRTLSRLKIGYKAIVQAEKAEAQQANQAAEEVSEETSMEELPNLKVLEELDDAEEKDQLESPIQE